MSETTQEKIKSTVTNHRIVIFMKGTPAMPMCGFSAATLEIFRALGAPFETVNVLSDPAIRDGVKAYTNWPTIPQVFVDGKFIGGCDIVREMSASGELKKLLEGPAAAKS